MTQTIMEPGLDGRAPERGLSYAEFFPRLPYRFAKRKRRLQHVFITESNFRHSSPFANSLCADREFRQTEISPAQYRRIRRFERTLYTSVSCLYFPNPTNTASMPQPKTRPDSPVPSLQGPCDRTLKSEVPCGSCLNWR